MLKRQRGTDRREEKQERYMFWLACARKSIIANVRAQKIEEREKSEKNLGARKIEERESANAKA